MYKDLKPSSQGSSLGILAILPLFYLLAYWVIGSLKGPYFFTPNQDPDYHYLSSSLDIATLIAPEYIPHPGTPLQLLEGLVLRIAYWMQSWFEPEIQPIRHHVLINSEWYLGVMNFALLLLTSILLFWLGKTALKLCQNLTLSLILQLTPFIAILSYLAKEPSRVEPETLLFCISLILVIVLLNYLYTEQAERSPYLSISLGIICGVGSATKFSFLPMLIFILLIQGVQRKVLALGVTVASFILVTLPIFTQYPILFGWLFRRFTGVGNYGSKSEDLSHKFETFRYLEQLFSKAQLHFSLLFLLTLLCGIIFWLGRSRQWNLVSIDKHIPVQKLLFLSGVLVLALWSQIGLIVIKSSHVRYLAAGLALLGLVIFLSVQLVAILILNLKFPSLSPQQSLFWCSSIALALTIAISIQQTVEAIDWIEDDPHNRQKDLRKISRLYERSENHSCVRVTNRRASTLESALEQANYVSHGHYSDILMQVQPQSVFFDLRFDANQKIDVLKFRTSDQQSVPLSQLLNQGEGCILLHTNLNWRDIRNRFKHMPEIKKVYIGKKEGLYRYTPSSSPNDAKLTQS